MRIRFGEFVLDNEARTLERAGALVRLSPKAFELLEILISERPKAISKNELLERVWPDVVVEEENIKNLVWEIRGVLGDAGKDPRFLRTVRRFGYAFSGDAAEEGLRSNPGAQFWLYHRSSAFPLKPGELFIGRDPSVESGSMNRASRDNTPG